MTVQKRWLFNKSDDGKAIESAGEMAASLGVPEPVINIMINRGLKDKTAIKNFLNPLEQPFVSPFMLTGMQEATDRIILAIDRCENIVIYGDYDVDGITSTVVLHNVLTELGAQVSYYIPERESDGYGINIASLEKLLTEGAQLLISVDCGISSYKEIAAVQGRLDVIVTDHHELPELLPKAVAVINPKQDEVEALKSLAGVGVVYKLCQGLWEKVRRETYEGQLEIVALGTIADIVPLTGENRLLAARGLAAMTATKNLGLQALIKVAGLADSAVISSGDVGFKLAPRLNAAGRMDSAVWGVKLLLTGQTIEAETIAERLNAENAARQKVEADILAMAEAEYLKHEAENQSAIVVAGAGWHVGVIGIVASRLVERYYKPTVVLSLKEDGTAAGSCRSIAGFAIHEALNSCGDLLLKHGGHAQAAGLTMEIERLSDFRRRFNELAAGTLSADDYMMPVRIDAAVELKAVDFDFIDAVEALAPFGMGNSRPVFAALGMEAVRAEPMGKEGQFVRFEVKQADTKLGGVIWDTSYEASDLLADRRIDMAFQPSINEWNGRRSIQLVMNDYRRDNSVKSRLDELFQAGRTVDPYANIGSADSFFTKAVGTSFENRQSIIAGLKKGDEVIVRRDKHNEHDKNAVMLLTADGSQVGFLKADIARHLAPLIDKGREYTAAVADVTGRGHEVLGLNIIVRRLNIARASLLKQCKFITRDEVRELLIGKNKYHQAQLQAIEAVERQQNTLLVMGTGRGKSAVFQTQAIMQAVNNNKLTLLVYPLRALVNDQYMSLQRRLSKLGLELFKANGTLSGEERQLLSEAIQNKRADIILTTPEYLAAHIDMFAAQRDDIGLVVIDESHHIADGSKRSGYKKLSSTLKQLNEPTVLAVTATADDKTARLICDTLAIDNVIIDAAVRENIKIRDARNYDNKLSYIAELIGRQEKTLLFVNSRRKAVELADSLREIYPQFKDTIGFYHAGLSDEWRVQVEDWFRNGELQVVAATSAFGEGIDLPDIRNVVLYHLPFDSTSFNQQCGRAGRDGAACMVHLLFGDNDIRLNELILKERAPERDAVGALYLALKQAVQQRPFVELTNGEISAGLQKNRSVFLGEGGVASGLKILEELGLIRRETNGSRRKIYLNPPPQHKLDIASSDSYIEGMAEKDAFSLFARSTMERDILDLLAMINRPIFPAFGKMV